MDGTQNTHCLRRDEFIQASRYFDFSLRHKSFVCNKRQEADVEEYSAMTRKCWVLLAARIEELIEHHFQSIRIIFDILCRIVRK
jgi:hypothetical protein